AQHILPPGFQKIRYYGFMSPNNKLNLHDARWLVWLYLGWTYWLGSAFGKTKPPKRKPPSCQDCGADLTLVAMTDARHRIVWRKSITVRGPPL
ncbi:MAG: transposase, partial [Planctomycetota bacterium]